MNNQASHPHRVRRVFAVYKRNPLSLRPGVFDVPDDPPFPGETTEQKTAAYDAPQPKQESASQQVAKDPRVYLAAERTFLAWIRTGLALMGFGFVLARFGFLLRSLTITGTLSQTDRSGFSISVGTVLILIGVAVQVLSLAHHRRFINDLNSGTASFDRPSALASAIAVVMAVIGLAMAIHLLMFR
jgi:putative membrane protein